jgi:ATP-dependent DNA helicase RecG
MIVSSRPERDSRETPKQSFDFKKRTFVSPRIPGAYLFARNVSPARITGCPNGYPLTRAAALMFHPEPQRFFTGAYLKIGYFETNVDLRYQDEVAGDLIFQVNQGVHHPESHRGSYRGSRAARAGA